MAPKRGTKRASQTQSEDAVDKKLFELLKTQGISRPTYKAVVEALEHPLLVVPEDCRAMLMTVAPKSLCVPADERHEMQAQCVEMIGEAIREVQTRMQEAVAAEQAEVVKVENTKCELLGKLQQAKVVLTQKQEALETSKHVLADASGTVLSAKATLTSAHDEKSSFDASCVQIRSDKERFEGVISNDLKKLREGTWEEGESKKHFDALAALFGKFALEESLLAVLPGALMKKPTERGSFDLMAVTQLDESIQAKLLELTSAVEQQAPQAQERDAAVASAQKNHDEASEEQKKAASAMGVAQEEEQTAIAAVTDAEAALANGEVEFQKVAEVRDQKKNELEVFQYSIGCFDQLKDRTSSKIVQGATEDATEAQPAVAGA